MKWPRDYGPELGNRRIAANRLIISRRRSSGSGQGCLAGVADLSAGGAVLSAAGGFVFAAGFLASPHPVTATTATNSIAANSCFMFDLLKRMGKLSPAIGVMHLNITFSSCSA
jgi:hypothetical protein